MFIMALMATNWELFKKSKSKSEKINLVLLDLLASPQVKIEIVNTSCQYMHMHTTQVMQDVSQLVAFLTFPFSQDCVNGSWNPLITGELVM